MKEEEIKKITNWVQTGINDDAVQWADNLGEILADIGDDGKPLKTALTSSQLRRFFGEVKRVQMNGIKNKKDIVMLKPLLAYAEGRATSKNKGSKIKDFREKITKALDEIRDDENLQSDFENFVKLFEAIVAYHKFHGGKE